MDHQPGPSIRAKKKRRDSLIRLAHSREDWALGFQDETWWSRFAKPNLHAWSDEKHPLRLVEQDKRKDDPDPKALACYGLLLRWTNPEDDDQDDDQDDEVLLRFVDGRPVSEITIQYLQWVCDKLWERGMRALIMIWDNASWHTSGTIRTWIVEHNCEVKEEGKGVRILANLLPTKSPWLNPIEPVWLHAKRRIVEPNGTLSAAGMASRICATLGCSHEPHLCVPENVS